ncbi:flagellar assembly protein T N-terminal domain-containing protein [Ferrimonas balearica]|uniref:flagellar assembly protein T N-terminal domain-containing protein n=1 Tax=Ferrimonas balearica TaxID=44012 RepID=UPI001C994450|nr:flagellar assembly protein T N-terminal domain-containing protein [Ferrimonas balearica]MBY5992921.1 flagella assembly protein FlgT [Ferrimonas balearica]
MTLLRPLLLATLLLSPSALAGWVTVHGQAQIINDNLDQARERAIDRALSQALMQSGAQLDYQQRSQNGVLMEEELHWQAQAEVESMELLSERRSGNHYKVELRVLLQSTALGECQGPAGRVAISVPRAQVRYREQLVPGGLYELDGAFARLLGNTLNGEGRYAFATARDDLRIDMMSPDRQWVRSLGEQDHSQYVLAVVFDDLSVDRPDRVLGYWERDASRNLALEATLYDAFTTERVWSQRYRSQGGWPYERQEMADTATEKFWGSDFGAELRRVGTELVRDLNQTLACQPLKGRILELTGDTAVVTLGLRHGLRPGDRLQIVQQQDYWGQAGSLTLTLEQVEPERARARFSGAAAQMGVQVGDWVQRAPR